jgi:polar amino acid transport system substrate-binding protein
MTKREFLHHSGVLSLLTLGAVRADDAAPLRIGMELTYPPFEMSDTTGKPDGVGVKMAEALAAHLKRPLKIVPMDFSGLIPALKTGSIDLIISSMTATDERRQSISFSEPYAFTGLALLVAKDSPVQSIADLNAPGRKIVVKSTTTGESWATAHLPTTPRTAFESEVACVMEVAAGRADAFIYDQLSIFRYHQKQKNKTRAILQPFKEEAWAIGVAKNGDTLRARVNEFITTFRASGGFEKLGAQFLSEEKKLLEEMKVPFILR